MITQVGVKEKSQDQTLGYPLTPQTIHVLLGKKI